MKLRWGSKSFDVNGAGVAMETEPVASASNRPLRRRVRFDCHATILGTSQADLSAKEEAFNVALAVPYLDLVLERNDGVASEMALFTRESLSGVTITSGPNWADTASPGEYVRFRTVRFSGTAEFLLPSGAGALVSWQESISVTGNGGPVRRWRIPLNARKIRQVVSPTSMVTVVQSGQAIGHLAYPLPPPPRFGRAFLVNEREAIVRGSPQPVGRAWVNFPISWNYVFEPDGPPAAFAPALPQM